MKKGMIKFRALYPYGEGKKFDMDYYCNKHLPLVSGLLGDVVKMGTVEKWLAGGEPGVPAPYIAMGHLYFDSMEAFQKSFSSNMDAIVSDIPNFTNIQPVVQISEVFL